MQLGFALDISPREGDHAAQSRLFRNNIVAPDGAESAANSALPALVEVASNTECSVQSANAAAERVAAYYAPLEKALELVDRLLNAVSKFTEVSASSSETNGIDGVL